MVRRRLEVLIIWCMKEFDNNHRPSLSSSYHFYSFFFFFSLWKKSRSIVMVDWDNFSHNKNYFIKIMICYMSNLLYLIKVLAWIALWNGLATIHLPCSSIKIIDEMNKANFVLIPWNKCRTDMYDEFIPNFLDRIQ